MTRPAAGDDRTAGQRRAQALADLAQVVLDQGLAGAGRAVRPRINVLISEPRFRALAQQALERQTARAQAHEQGRLPIDGVPPTACYATRAVLSGDVTDVVAQFEDGTPVSRPLLDFVSCDSEFNRYLFGAHSQVLDVGRAERTFTGARRAAVVARDRHCRYPGCTAPPVLCHCHHIVHWSADGSTSVKNGILLCFHHHELVHRRHITIHRDQSRFVFLDRHGMPINPDHDHRILRT
jgi:hypothetical protein